ncbi:MAG: DMT family transporter [Chloroflexota bacterium]
MVALIIQILVGIIGGIASGLQAIFAGLISQRIGELESVFFTYVGGGVLATVLIFALKGGGNIGAWRTVPWYAFLTAPLGLVIIGSLSYAVPRLGAAATTVVFVTAWLIFTAIFDHFGWLGLSQRSLDLPRIMGVVIMLLGTWLVTR